MTVEQWLGKDNQLGIDIWKKKYQRNNETFDEWLNRVSAGNSDVAELIFKKKFLFGGRILSNRGVEDEKVTYSNCYVVSPPEDNIESIYECASKLARTYSYGGGCGIDISKLAPEGARVRNQAKSTSGAVSFMDTFSQVTEQIGQNGRRGALMISISCTHPDLEKFITVKSDLKKVTSANISVRVTNDFMRAVQDDKDWELSFIRPETDESTVKTVKARDIWHLLCKNNWNYAEPGILFWDTIEGYNLNSNNLEFSYAGTNPCAEEPLPAGGSCLLGALNLSEYVTAGEFNFNEFENDVYIAIRALNEVLDEGLPKHPLQEQRDSVRDWRQVGLGVMGIADMLIKMHIRYGSKEAIELCDKIGRLLAQNALIESTFLAEKEGTYTRYNSNVIDSMFFQNHTSPVLEANVKLHGLRNSQLLTIAPTGTISTMLGVSGGIEPIFATHYNRTTKSLHGKDVTYKVYTPIVKEYIEKHNLKDETELPDYFITSAQIPYKDRIDMQAVWQTHIDASISSTVNLPNETTIKEVEDLYMYAWKKGLKGITIYRAGCAREGILVTDETNKLLKEHNISYDSIIPVSRKTFGTTHGNTYCKKCACGTLYITLNRDDNGNIVESFINTSKGGICQANIGAINRMISVALRSGVKVDEIVDQLKGITCPACTKMISKGENISGISCPDILAKTLQEEYKGIVKFENKQKKRKLLLENNTSTIECPECGEQLIHDGGCVTCTNCGWSKCN